MRWSSLSLLVVLSACGGGGGGARDAGSGVPAVDVQLVEVGKLREPLWLSGTTRPVQLVSVRARSEGRVESLPVDVGDAVAKDQSLGEIDAVILQSALREAEASLANARAQAASAEANATQARVEAERYEKLAEKGISSRQEAEQRQTALRTAESLAKASLAQVDAQLASVAAAKERRAFAALRSPIRGVILERLVDVGAVVQVGAEVLRVGDLSSVEVVVNVSELDLHRVEVGREVRVKLDAYPARTFVGKISRASPQADPNTRLVPIEVVIANPEKQVASGLFARVELDSGGDDVVLIPEGALSAGRGGGPGGKGAAKPAATGKVFLVGGSGGDGGVATIEERDVTLGMHHDGRVEVSAGLAAGDPLVVRAVGKLSAGAKVKPSFLSERAAPKRDGPP